MLLGVVCGVVRAGELDLRGRVVEALAPAREIVFAERVSGTDHWYVNFGFYACPTIEYPANQCGAPSSRVAGFKDGGRLCALDLVSGKVRILLDDPEGGVRDPVVDYDGKRIVFSYRPRGQSRFKLFEIFSDGSGLRQITHGPGDDIEPVILPDGGIMFCSSRANRYVNCWRSPVATLYRCDGDGRNVRMISSNIEHDNTPWVLRDGRVLFMRWEYVDRNQLVFHHLWTVNPDGTGQSIFYGNSKPGGAMLDAKPLPQSNQVITSFSPGHGRPEHVGSPMVIDPDGGPDFEAGARTVLPPKYRDPLPLGKDLFLAASGKEIVAFDGLGNLSVLWKSEGALDVHEPRPLKARLREPIIAPRSAAEQKTGKLYLSDILHGRNMTGIAAGEIAKLLVLEQLPKPINFSGGPYPISNGGTFTLSRVLGTVPVHEDGSAYFEVPALRSLFFVALDRNDRAVKRMHSFVTVQPGETTGCIGCHEHRTLAPPVKAVPAAVRRQAAQIAPIEGVPEVFDYPRDIQPILERHCVSCHNPLKYDGQVDLCGDQTPVFSVSFGEMMRRSLFTDGRNELGNSAPRSIGSGNSRILELVSGSHYGAQASEREKTILRLWIDSSAPFAGTYAALGSGMHVPKLPTDIIDRRCGECHGLKPQLKEKHYRFGAKGLYRIIATDVSELPKERAGHGKGAGFGYTGLGEARSAHELCNLSRPGLSLFLRAPLAKSAGGLELCGKAVLASTDEADYRALFASIEEAAARRREEKRFDMPAFRPNVYYLIKMQEYGVLPAAFDVTKDSADGYALDRLYWKTFWYPGSLAGQN